VTTRVVFTPVAKHVCALPTFSLEGRLRKGTEIPTLFHVSRVGTPDDEPRPALGAVYRCDVCRTTWKVVPYLQPRGGYVARSKSWARLGVVRSALARYRARRSGS